MSELTPKSPEDPIYPTVDGVHELERRANMISTGANVHQVKNVISALYLAVLHAEKHGWSQTLLQTYGESKLKLNQLLAGVKPD